MPVIRYRTVDEARRDLWLDRDDPSLPRAIESVWRLSERLSRQYAPFPRGVHKYRSIEEANEAVRKWLIER